MQTERVTHPDGSEREETYVDLFPPEGEGNGAAVLLLHGGAWAMGDRTAMHGYARLLSAHGFLAAAVQYRLLPEAPWPAQLEDVRAAVWWIKSQSARLGIDPDKVALMGFSAGGHLSLLTAGTADGSGFEDAIGDGTGAGVAGVVACFSPVILAGEYRMPPVDALLRGGDDDAALAASPVTYANPSFPPTFFLNGADDGGVPLETTLGLFQRLRELGAGPELHVLSRQTHEFSALPGMIEATIAEAAFFLQRAVVEPERFDEENRRLNIFADPEALAAAMRAAAAAPPA